MIAITIEKTGGSYRRLACRGHALYAPRGKDVVCAAASILVINTLNAMEALADARFVVRSDQEKGLIDAVFPGELNDKATVLMDALVMGLSEVSKQYGKQYITFQMKEVEAC